jgi:ribosomal-protein-alanine N-acetyltransferase
VRAGFVLGRAIAGEAELLTLAVDPDHRRGGLGRHLVRAFEGAAMTRKAEFAYLEVGADNPGAYALYLAMGYSESGRRPRYYNTPEGAKIDAILMKKSLQSA